MRIKIVLIVLILTNQIVHINHVETIEMIEMKEIIVIIENEAVQNHQQIVEGAIKVLIKKAQNTHQEMKVQATKNIDREEVTQIVIIIEKNPAIEKILHQMIILENIKRKLRKARSLDPDHKNNFKV